MSKKVIPEMKVADMGIFTRGEVLSMPIPSRPNDEN